MTEKMRIVQTGTEQHYSLCSVAPVTKVVFVRVATVTKVVMVRIASIARIDGDGGSGK